VPDAVAEKQFVRRFVAPAFRDPSD